MKHITHNNSKKGFTLIEILVVLGIIAIIIGLGVVSYSSAQKKARDARRLADVQSIQDAFEQYYSICGFDYPNYVTMPTSIVCSTTGETIMSSVPTDPLLGTAYVINPGSAANKTYTICPPIVRDSGVGNYRMELSNCNDSSKTCCVSNVQ